MVKRQEDLCEKLIAIGLEMAIIKVDAAKYHIKEIKVESMEVLVFYFTQLEILSQIDDAKEVGFNEREVML